MQVPALHTNSQTCVPLAVHTVDEERNPRHQMVEEVEDSKCSRLLSSLQGHGTTRRQLFGAVGVLILISILTSIVILKDITQPGALNELDFELFNYLHDGSSLGWQIFNLTSSALAPLQNNNRPTLAEILFVPECAEAWIATGILCDQIAKGEIPVNIQKALKISTVHTWVNGSDQRLQDWKEALAPPRTRIGDSTRHFRCREFHHRQC